MLTPQHVANYFLERAARENRGLSPIKLLKLVYIGYGWYLALTGEKLFAENIQAWQHGPVIPSLYHEFKHYRSNAIDEYSTVFDLDSFEEQTPRVPSSSQEAMVLEKVWESYKRFSGWALRDKTHQPDSPWSAVYKQGKQNIKIPDDKIEAHFQERIGLYLDAAKSPEPAE